jgi:tRNA dimethylallyltransferase
MASSPRGRHGPRAAVLALFGPTAAGKTAVARELCERLDAVPISADSASLYDRLPIITAAPDYPTLLVGSVPLAREVSLGEYQRLAHDAIDATIAHGRLPLVVGGTGLYFRAALSALELPPPPAAGVRERWEAAYAELGPEAAHRLLEERDPPAAARVHPNDRRRVVRALELHEAGASLAPAVDRLWTEDTRLPTTIVALDVPLDELDRRIERRTRGMAARGAQAEARAAWSQRLSGTARKVLGLEQFATLAEADAVEQVAQATKRLARYQRKWLRRVPNVITLDGDRPAEEVADEIADALAGAGERLPRQ